MKNFDTTLKTIKWIILLPILGVLITSFTLTIFFVNSKQKTFEEDIKFLEKETITQIKNKIRNRVKNLSNVIDNTFEHQINESKENIKDFVYMGHSMLELIYKNNPNKSKEELYKIIDENINKIRLFENKSGYFFIYDYKNAKSISLPSTPNLVGKSLINITDKNGKNLFYSYKKILDNKDAEGFDTGYWNKPNSSIKKEKIGFIKLFKPLNIVIGTAVYTEDIKNNIGKNIIKLIENINFDDGSYIFILNKKGVTISHKNKDIIGIPFEELSKKTKKNVRVILDKIEKTQKGFVEYNHSAKFFDEVVTSKKISYLLLNESFNWIIGTGSYTDNLNEQIIIKKNNLEKKLSNELKIIVAISAIISLIVIILLFIISKKIKQTILYYSSSLEKKNEELEHLNISLEKKVKYQVDEMRKKDIILNQQSKLVSMGEMLGNVAHQWRQPLSAISTLASGILVQKQLEILDEKIFESDLENIVKTTQVLSNTIDDFRNFYSNKKEKISFSLEELLENTLNLIDANIKNHNIQIFKNIEDITIYSYRNELIQILLNLLNNSKDALKEIDNENRLLFIDMKKFNNNLQIEIYDNANGIKEEIINRIFEPYFTTKFKSQGTGIGLYMTKTIIEKSLNGTIVAENYKFEFKNKKYTGARFTLKLPF